MSEASEKRRNLSPEDRRKNCVQEVCVRYAETLKRMVDCKTVFTRDFANQREFDRFYRVLSECFPTLSAKAERLSFGSGCFIYALRGASEGKHVMLMSHHDVVEGGEDWATDPFRAEIRDGALYGRGAIDTKTPLFAQLQACEELLREGYDFGDLNLYIGSSNNEEVCGDGMVLAAEYFKKQGIRFAAIVDEGGAITTGMIPGVRAKSAMIAVHEKGRHLYRCTARQNAKGHGGLNPTDDSAVSRLTAFIHAVEGSRIYRGRFSSEVRATFEAHAPYMDFPLNLLFGNFRLFSPLIRRIMMGIPQARAMLSTGISFTTLSAGSREDPQIRAKEAEATMFLRCVREEDLLRGLEKIRKIAGKHGVQIEEMERDYCRPTSFEGRPYRLLEAVLHENFPDVITAPFLLTAGTDARRFSEVADSILRFAPIDLNKAQFASIHGANEHIMVSNIGQCVCFYKDLIKKYKECGL